MSTNIIENDNVPDIIDRNTNRCNTPRLNVPNNINNYFENNEEERNNGAVSLIKETKNVRVLSINPHGCVPNNRSKMEMLKEAIRKLQVDIILMNEVNTKWNTLNISRLERHVREVDRESNIVVADSGEWETTPGDYLPGGVMSVILSKCCPLINKKEIKKGRLGNWIAIPLQHKGKRVEIICIYRIPSSSSNGVKCSLTQYNRIDGEMSTSTVYRKELFKDVEMHVRNNTDINNIIIAGDYNQYLNDNEVRKFHDAISVHEIHSIVNDVQINQIGRTYKHGSKPIDSFAATSGIMEYVDGCEILGYNEVVESDHRSYLVDISLEEYFNDEMSEWDTIDRVKINPSKRSHRKIFYEEIEHQLNIYNVENDLERMERSCSYNEIEVVDEIITRMLQTATKKVEGMKRSIPFSQEKERRRSMVLYYKMKIREIRGGAIDAELKEKRKVRAGIIDEVSTIQEAKNMLEIAKELWSEMIQKGREFREQELLDYHPVELIDEGEKLAKKKKKVIAGIRRKLKRDHTFHYLSRHVGKGVKDNIKRLQVVNDDDSKITLIQREEIESRIQIHNTNHFKKAHESIAYKDKIYNKLRLNSIRDKILNGTLSEDDCDDERVFRFLKLLKQNGRSEYRRDRREISNQDLIKVVRKSKRSSASSIFSKRTYAVYKCAIESERMTEVLVRFYNILIRNEYYPKRWLNILDVMIGKGKGMVLGKLRIITLIEADLQYLMRIFLGDEIEEMIETDSRFSSANYSSRKNYSIESALLEKRLIFDNSMLSGKKTMCTITDMQSCYDRQLAEIGGILEESVGRDRAVMKLISKVIPKWRHYICTGFGISDFYYGGENDPLAGTGQGNRFSGDVCRDSSCLIIRNIERMNVGMNFESRVSGEIVLKVVVAFVDDNDMVADGENIEVDMNRILNEYNDLHSATGGQIEEQKSKFYAYQWKIRSGKKVIQNINQTVKINDKELDSLDCNKSERMLGVTIGPALTWDCQFVVMVNKMKEAIGKLKNAVVIVSTASMYYNMYLCKKVYFGCGVLYLNRMQEDILKKIYEPVILKKLGLSEKFPRSILYSRRTALGVGLMAPNTIISVLALKLYIGHNRVKSEISKMIKINEENARLFYGYSDNVMDVELENKPNIVTWSDEVQHMLSCRDLKIINRTNDNIWISKNESIMDYVVKYVKEKKYSYDVVEAINHVRLFKKMILPCELVGLKGDKETKEAREVCEKSSIIWKVQFEEVRKPHKRLIEVWYGFVQWIKEQQIKTVVDFYQHCSTRYEITNDDDHVRMMVGNDFWYYKAKEVRYGRKKYERIEEISINGWRRCIGEMKPSREMIIYSKFPIEVDESNIEIIVPFSREITDSVRNKTAIAATDASVKESNMGGCWIISDKNKSFEKEHVLYHKRWIENNSDVAEVLVLLELLEVIEAKGRHINEGEINIGFDLRKAHKKIINNIMKSNEYAQESGAEISRIKDILQKIKFTVKIILIRGHENPSRQENGLTIKHLIKECDEKAKKTRLGIMRNERVTNIKYYGNYSLMHKGIVVSRAVQEVVRIIDSKKAEEQYQKKKLGYKYDFIDKDARSSFRASEVTPSMIKCTHGFNHYGVRESMFNDEMIDDQCPRCGATETWDHIIKCNKTIELRKKYIEKLLIEMLKNRDEVDINEIMSFCEDILRYLENDVEEEYETNQYHVGMSELFRGYVVLDWKDANFDCRKYSKLNKIIVRNSVTFYNECWKDRNESMHDEQKQKERLRKWFEKEKAKAEQSEYRQIRLYVQRCKVDIVRCNCVVDMRACTFTFYKIIHITFTSQVMSS